MAQLRGGYSACAGASIEVKAYRAGNSVRTSATIARGTTKINNAANIATRHTLNISKNSASMGSNMHRNTARLLEGSKGAANKLSGAANSYFGGVNKATGTQLAVVGILYSILYSHLNTIPANQGQGSHEGG